MLSKPRFPFLFALNLIILVELFSFTAYFLPSIQAYLLAASFLAVFLLSLKNLEIGLLIAAVELVIGSKGHLFSQVILGFPVSLRLAIWVGLMLATLIFITRYGFKRSWQDYLRSFKFWPYLFAFVSLIVIGIIQGLLRGYEFATIFADANAWLFLSLLIPILLVYGQGDKEKLNRLKLYFLLALGWLSFKTLALVFIFSHNLVIMPDIYLWVRRSGIGEITAMGGGWQRVFIQSQIYAPIAYFALLWPLVMSKIAKKRQTLILVALSVLMAVIIISMSRSFWLAFGAAGAMMAVYSFKLEWKKYLRAFSYILISLAGAALLIFVTVRFPYPDPNAGLSAEALAARLDFSGDEAALASRWAQLPNLWSEIRRSPVVGLGFGSSVSYFSQDPRVLAENPDGWYTTYAFEWAYLDTWLKLGLFGLIPFLAWLILQLLQWLKVRGENQSLYLSLAVGLIFLMIVNIFTPYLNHPLGLAFVLFSSCFFHQKHYNTN